jgi:two-component system NtrC family sensor kinase
LSHTLIGRLIALLVAAMAAVFAVVGYLNIRLQRQHLEGATLQSAELVGDTIKRSISYYMLQNDREGLYHAFTAMAGEPGVVRIRIFNQYGGITLSTEPSEVNTYVDRRAEACYACHAKEQPLAHVDRPSRFRIFRLASGERVFGIINPIENQPACWNAACHAHPESQKILGVLDTNLSLASVDASLVAGGRRVVAYTLLAIAGIALLTGLFVWRVAGVPMKLLKEGTQRLGRGELGYQLEVRSADEIGQLAESFNGMSRQLREAREEITSWTRTLETRVEEKTRELNRAHEHMLQVEKMASLGKLAATVAHEINNPLAGILTYSKLLKKWLDRNAWGEDQRTEIRNSLDLMESESRRCGEIVRNLLMFSRAAPMRLERLSLNAVIERCANLVQHQTELANSRLQLHLDKELPTMQCDPGQIEQVVLALVMNAIDATRGGGNICLRTRQLPDTAGIEFQVCDDGSGIPPDVLPHIFEPFFTTKEDSHSTGLGLAVSRSIVERHHGRIEVESKVGSGTVFTLTLPTGAPVPRAPAEPSDRVPAGR